jgi:hypothetical protein
MGGDARSRKVRFNTVGHPAARSRAGVGLGVCRVRGAVARGRRCGLLEGVTRAEMGLVEPSRLLLAHPCLVSGWLMVNGGAVRNPVQRCGTFESLRSGGFAGTYLHSICNDQCSSGEETPAADIDAMDDGIAMSSQNGTPGPKLR